MTSLAHKIAEQVRGVGKSSEWRRIAALPRRVLDLANVPDLTPIWRKDPHGCPGCDLCASGNPHLLPVQSAALFEAEQFGLFAPIGVGHGKTLLGLLLPDAMQAQRAVYLVKPRLRDQLVVSDIPRYGRHFRLPLDRLTIVSYTELSSATKGDVLERLEPDLIIADEAHVFRHSSAARTKRFLRYMADHPGCRFVPLSGTMATRSVRDFWHLADHALRASSPAPRIWRDVEDWSRALDPPERIEGRTPLAPGAIAELCGPEARAEVAASVFDEQRDVKGRQIVAPPEAREVARRVFGRRLAETPGVVSIADPTVDCSLVISALRVEVPPVVQAAFDELRKKWSIASEELRDAKDVHRFARQLACGFYYRWAWPGGVPDFEWLEARAAWRGEVRKILSRSRAGLDSPLLVANAAEREELNDDALDAWAVWKAVRERPEPPTEAIWLDERFLFDDVLRWCERCQKDDAPGIVWYQHLAVEERLRALGVPVFGAGAVGLDKLRVPFAAMSIEAHSEGWNLQHHFCRNRVISCPANAKTWEQFLGRTHRRGQEADEVEVDIDQHDASLRSAFARALEQARFLESSMQQRQRICYAERVGFDA